jgi:hypothetical protein
MLHALSIPKPFSQKQLLVQQHCSVVQIAVPLPASLQLQQAIAAKEEFEIRINIRKKVVQAVSILFALILPASQI